MRILIISYHFPPLIGGMSTYAFEIARNLPSNCRITIIVPVYEETAQKLFKGRMRVFPLLTKLLDVDLQSVQEFIKNEKSFDAMHIMHSSFSPALLRLKDLSVPVLVTVHGKDFFQPWLNAKKTDVIAGIKLADNIIAVSNLVKDRLKSLHSSRSITVIPHGTNPLLFRPKNKSRMLLEKLSIPTGNFVIMTACRINDKKNLQAIIGILSELKNVTYLVVGPAVKNNYFAKLKTIAVKYGVQDKIIFTGPINYERLSDYYNLSDIYIMPSIEPTKGDIESFGIAYLEAAACGKPIIASKYAGAADIIKRHKLGFVVDPRNKKEMLRKIRLLLGNKRLRDQMGRNGRNLVVKEYNWKNVAMKTLRVYKDAIRKKDFGRK